MIQINYDGTGRVAEYAIGNLMDEGKLPPGLRHVVVDPEWKLDERDAARRRRALQELKQKTQGKRPG